jgi:hypothetical protein
MIQMDTMSKSEFHGPNLGYALKLPERYQQNTDLVDEGSRLLWRSW